MIITDEAKAELRACEMKGKAPAVCPACGATERDACMIDNPRTPVVDEIERLRDALAAAEAERDRLLSIERAARALRRHIRNVAYRDSGQLRLNAGVWCVDDLDAALGAAPCP